jgi:hypothetical protein
MRLVHEGVFKIGAGGGLLPACFSTPQLQLSNHTPANCIRSMPRGKKRCRIWHPKEPSHTFQRSDFGFTDFKIVMAVKEAFR